MAFFPRNCYNADSSFTPLFRLLDDFDSYSRQNDASSSRRSGLPSWQPKFDIREVNDHYELHGDLPGVNKDQVHIEFTDPQTMLVRGRVERAYSAGSPPAGHIEDVSNGGAITEGEDSKLPHKATVEDEGSEQSKQSSEDSVEKKLAEKKAPSTGKWWLTERSVGEFSRSFNFPSRIEQEAVTASFKDGVLNIVVPKAKKRESRRIPIN
ncbi:hypothetical protein CDD82_7434 [Ophiocordyceps australis]|uniref:SHSP domain-containing protein n=1 Tax=Ophiocordyceps australis TaxID=1399860 RepID=A0A2C5YQC3_9HYPO|nr:hypothetical protein CDD82_7434 [Ophiocordyceps australis]